MFLVAAVVIVVLLLGHSADALLAYLAMGAASLVLAASWNFFATRVRLREGVGMSFGVFWLGSVVALLLALGVWIHLWREAFFWQRLGVGEQLVLVGVLSAYCLLLALGVYALVRPDAGCLGRLFGSCLMLVASLLVLVVSPWRDWLLPRTTTAAHASHASRDLPVDAFDAELRETYQLRESTLRYTGDFTLRPRGDLEAVAVDASWFTDRPSRSVRDVERFRLGSSSERGLAFTVEAEFVLHRPERVGTRSRVRSVLARNSLRVTRLGWLRNTFRLPTVSVPVIVERRARTGKREQLRAYVGDVSIVSGERELEMPKNAFLNSYPRMSLIALPDRDQLTIPLSEGVDRTEVYYLSSFRLAIVRTVLASTSVPDALLKVFGYVMWPVLVLVLAAFQRNLAEVLLRPFRKKDSTRRIGFR